VRNVFERETQDVRTAEAVAPLCCQVKKVSGAVAAALGGLDARVFARGSGQNEPPVGAGICDWLGVRGMGREERRHAADAGVSSAAANRVAVRVIRTDEERMIAETVCRVLGLG
jgi:acetate kinase